MRVLALLALMALAVPAHASAPVQGVTATAAGTARFVVTDWLAGGQVVCDAGALFAVDSAGVLAWHAPGCDAPDATGAAYFAFHCSDACFQDCSFFDGQLSCDRRDFTLDGAVVTTSFTLRRDGSFTFLRATWGQDVDRWAEAQGTLAVLSWPEWG